MVAAWRLRSTTLASLGTRKRHQEKEEDVNKDGEEQVINVHVRKKSIPPSTKQSVNTPN